jgi:plasmid replication initiation protein
MNEVVKYHNNMNLVNFKDFTEVEFNIFFAVCQQMRDKNLSRIELSFEKIRELTNYSNRSIPRLIKDIENTYTKLLQSNIRIETEEEIIRFVLFTEFKINKNKQIVSIRTNQEFEYVLNAVTSNFTRFELEQFVSLSKINSKTIYRMLKQFRMTGIWSIEYQEFLEMIGVSHWSRMDINREFKRIVKDLEPFFKNLVVEKVKKGGKQTGAILKLNWTFDYDEKYIGWKNIKVGDLEKFYIFLCANFNAGKIIAVDDDGNEFYFAPDGELRSMGKDRKYTIHFGDMNKKETALYQTVKKISKLKMQKPNTMF